jgi:Ca2+-binding RTX toxin-like protein
VDVDGAGTTNSTRDVIASVENFIGGAGNDTIVGDSLNNRLTGGLGADNLTGGLGADTFAYSSTNQSLAGTRDIIADFLSGTDKLDFSGIDANVVAGGNQAFTSITSGNIFSGAAGELIYHYETIGSTEYTVVQGNTNNDTAADFEVAILGHINTIQTTDVIL